MNLVVLRGLALALALAGLAGCTGGDSRDGSSVLGTKFVGGVCAFDDGSTITPGMHAVAASNVPFTLVASNGRVAALAPAQTITNGAPESKPALDFQLAVAAPEGRTVTVRARLTNTTDCSIEVRDARVVVRPTDPAGAPTTLPIRLGTVERLLVPPGGEATGSTTHTVLADGTSEVSASLDVAVGVVR